MKVVLDTNVLISAFVFPGGPPGNVYDLVIDGDIGNVTSPALLAEFSRVLRDKFGWDTRRIEPAVLQVARISALVEPLTTIDAIADDPTDNRVLEAAVAGAVSHVVSGDGHLLALTAFRGILIVNPRSFLQLRAGR